MSGVANAQAEIVLTVSAVKKSQARLVWGLGRPVLPLTVATQVPRAALDALHLGWWYGTGVLN
jgi:hypothetical protein